jgi:hypothetical protein
MIGDFEPEDRMCGEKCPERVGSHATDAALLVIVTSYCGTGG